MAGLHADARRRRLRGDGGDDANPAVPGYDPDISAELYTTNGETTEHAHSVYGTLAFTPEMATCETAAESVPDDEWDPADCTSVFIFPDDEELVQAEFEKNIPFAIATAQSALDPDDPVSVVGRTAPDFVVDSFDVSYGDPQTVAVTARRSQVLRWMTYRINGGRPQFTFAPESQGGERYGDEGEVYYGEFRGTVHGARPGDTVQVQFAGLDLRRGLVQSEPFTYTVAGDSGADVLVIADEDVTGVNPTYPAGTTGPKYLDDYVAALDANGISHDTWDVDSQGVPHPLGVLAHYDAVIWELGDNRLTQDPEDELTDTFQFGPLPDLAVAEKEQFLTMAVRDYLNEGGKLLQTGETTGYFGLLGGSIGGIYYGLDGAPEEDCVVTEDFFSDCLLLADDFHQYWLGAFARTTFSDPTGITGTGAPLDGSRGELRRPGRGRQPAGRGRGVRAHQRLPAARTVPAVRRRGVEHLPGGGRRQPVLAGRGRRSTPARSTSTRRISGSPARSTCQRSRRPTPPGSSCSSRSPPSWATTTSSWRRRRREPSNGRRCPT